MHSPTSAFIRKSLEGYLPMPVLETLMILPRVSGETKYINKETKGRLTSTCEGTCYDIDWNAQT